MDPQLNREPNQGDAGEDSGLAAGGQAARAHVAFQYRAGASGSREIVHETPDAPPGTHAECPPHRTQAAPEEDLTPYEEGKVWCPKNLKPHHQVICELRMAGVKAVDIAKQMKMHEVSVGLILRSPPAREYMASRVEDMDGELQGMFSAVVEVFRDGLADTDIDRRLKTADMWLKAQGRYKVEKDKKQAGITAEDVIQKLLSESKNVQVNIDNRRVINQLPPGPDDMSVLERKSG